MLLVVIGVLVGDLDGEDDDGGRGVGQRLVDADLTVARVDFEGRGEVVSSLRSIYGRGSVCTCDGKLRTVEKL